MPDRSCAQCGFPGDMGQAAPRVPDAMTVGALRFRYADFRFYYSAPPFFPGSSGGRLVGKSRRCGLHFEAFQSVGIFAAHRFPECLYHNGAGFPTVLAPGWRNRGHGLRGPSSKPPVHNAKPSCLPAPQREGKAQREACGCRVGDKCVSRQFLLVAFRASASNGV